MTGIFEGQTAFGPDPNLNGGSVEPSAPPTHSMAPGEHQQRRAASGHEIPSSPPFTRPTIDPGADWEGMLEATYARFNDYRGRVAVSGPLGDKVGISIAGTLRHTDGYFKKASRTTPGAFDGNFLGLRQESIRAKLKFDLTEDLSVTLGGSYMHASDPRGVLFTPIENVPKS